MRRKLFLSVVLTAAVFAAQAQHEHHQPSKKDTVPASGQHQHGQHQTKKKDSVSAAAHHQHQQGQHPNKKKDTAPASRHHNMEDENSVPMSHAFSLNLPMTRNGSGTGWLPDASPMFGYMKHAEKWMFMAHGTAFLRYNNQDYTQKGSRGGEKVDAPNWFMLMGQRKVGRKGLFHFSGMFSLDELIAGGSGYPLLFQTGESYKGKPLIDRQHPHDFVSELSVSYTQALSEKIDVFGYIGYPGEPALGPVTFMHRPSSLDNPNAPITHHWVDATHITFGVATLGVRLGKFKLEGSSFTGREPNENRYSFDKARFDSWSGRLSMNPSRNWALQVSHGFVKSPEEIHPNEDVNKTTASAIYNTAIRNGNYFSGTALWGLNKKKGHDGENAALVEGAWHLNRNAFFARYEYAQKSSEELVLDENIYDHDAVFDVHALTLGWNYDLLEFANTRLAIGASHTFHAADSKLNSLYGKNPLSWQAYIRIYPNLMRMN